MHALSAANAPNQYKNISTQAVDQPTSTPPNVSAHIEHMLFCVYLIIYCDLLGFPLAPMWDSTTLSLYCV